MDTENINMGERIKYLRKKNNLTQKNIAGFLNVNQSFISKVEKGERSLSLDALEKLATLFGINLQTFYTDINEIGILSFDFRTNEITNEDLRTISDINRIALNLGYITKMLQ